MKKKTITTVVSTLILTFIIAPVVAAQTTTIPFFSSVFDTIDSYISIVTSILNIGKPKSTELANEKKAVSDKTVYGLSEENPIDLAGTEFDPVAPDGTIQLDESAGDELAERAATDKNQKTRNRTIADFKSISQANTIKTATRRINKAANEADKTNEKFVDAADKAMKSAKNTLSSQPVGTCDSSLCAENTQNRLIAQQIQLQSAALSLTIMTNAYLKINNNQQAILVKSEQDKRAQEAANIRMGSITSGAETMNRVNANRLSKTVY